MDNRLPAHLEVSGLIRSVEGAGGFAAVLNKGEREAGTILVVVTRNGTDSRLYERMPQLDGTRIWTCSRYQNNENRQEFLDYLSRRAAQDRDAWIIELDVADGERFIGINQPPA